VNILRLTTCTRSPRPYRGSERALTSKSANTMLFSSSIIILKMNFCFSAILVCVFLKQRRRWYFGQQRFLLFLLIGTHMHTIQPARQPKGFWFFVGLRLSAQLFVSWSVVLLSCYLRNLQYCNLHANMFSVAWWSCGLCLLSFVFCLLSFVFCLLSFVFCLLSFVFCLFCLLSFVFCLLSFVFCLLSFVFCLLSFVCCLLSWVLGWVWVLGVGCWVLGVGFWVLGVGCWVLGFGCWVLGVGCWVLGLGSWVVGLWSWVVGHGLLYLWSLVFFFSHYGFGKSHALTFLFATRGRLRQDKAMVFTAGVVFNSRQESIQAYNLACFLAASLSASGTSYVCLVCVYV
jgi:hypothetical protein